MATKTKSKAKQPEFEVPKQYFAFCACCQKIVSTSLNFVDESDPRVDKNRAEDLAGECPYKGCNGLCYRLSEVDNDDINAGIALVRNNATKMQRGFFTQGIIMGMEREHRSLQQAYGRLIVKSIKRFAKEDTDLRNEAFVKFCQKCLPIAESNDGLLPNF